MRPWARFLIYWVLVTLGIIGIIALQALVICSASPPPQRSPGFTGFGAGITFNVACFAGVQYLVLHDHEKIAVTPLIDHEHPDRAQTCSLTVEK
jgi:hypothetical protein